MEKLVKRFPSLIAPIHYFITLLLYVQCSLIIGVSAFPSVYGVYMYWTKTELWFLPLRLLGMSIVLAAGFFLYAMVVIFVVAFICFIFRLKIKEGRYYIYSTNAIKWANYNSLILIVRYTCINFLRVTPFITLFHRMMGAKMGRNVQINTAVIGDSCFLEVGDNSIIGGDVTLVAHVAEHDTLVIKKVKIGKNVTLGIMSIIMPGVEIGDHVMIAANSVLKKDTKVPSHTVWGGIPAKQLSSKVPSA
ncbi:MAG: hypothetical protein A2Z91_09565 [Deltaproteobacteria bacterium GWA2_38_16]|nr:MAG: hypothetical protein A2Z91_09565 [Deltaproteobacteria bacterium GWA2_38_16]OGQ02460.1 MAG: hypothetical protein A3D19_09165 [Deltaproteobacteria bacterium RIFCSPHIGHO2_02_FULL_38_15]OGQ33850.1 MAG: hypothetical protein A3A72_06505 [Deltaproteobacteria bacterium RIFCSPLOWO2_01_FULL_38_9]HBQ21086.1 hypothetical protein [Deltaproteobacteria bacterium]